MPGKTAGDQLAATSQKLLSAGFGADATKVTVAADNGMADMMAPTDAKDSTQPA